MGRAAHAPAFGLGVLINKRTGQAIFNPLLLGTAFVIVVLSVLNIPYDTYAASASPVSYLLLPATVSLAVPLYEKWDLLCKNLVAIVAGVLAGVMASLFSVLALALLLDLNMSSTSPCCPSPLPLPSAWMFPASWAALPP